MNRASSLNLRLLSSFVSGLFALTAFSGAARAGVDFSTGVSDDRLSLPEGPGSLEGVGDNVSVDVNMALMRWGIPIEVPAGFPAVTPELNLSYNSGAGSSVVGIGWSLDVPFIERMTSRGLPLYDGNDLFAANGSEELVLVSTANEPEANGTFFTTYRARFEQGFVRYRWHDQASQGRAGYWEAQYPDGSLGFFGADHAGIVVPEAIVEGGGGTFRYHLVEKEDVHGHRVRYDYVRDPGGAALLDKVTYVFDAAGTPRFSVTFSYASRTDLLSDCGSGRELVVSKRLTGISVYSNAQRLRRYALTYDAPADSGGLSRLAKVERFGLLDERDPIVFTFGYTRALGAQCATQDCESPYLVDMGAAGGVSLSSGRATLLDINGDALPDLLDTSLGSHRFFLNQLASDGSQQFSQNPVSSSLTASQGQQLGSSWMQVLDANGDGFTDLINGLTGTLLVNKGEGDWKEALALGASNGFPNLGEDANLRFLDYDNDKRIDVVHSESGLTRVYRNRGALGFSLDPAVQTLGTSFSADNAQFADMNGDGLLDVVRVGLGVVRYRLNLGWGRWTGTDALWTEIAGLPITADEMAHAMLEDLNGDGLADLVVVSGSQVKFALNRNGASFDPAQTLTGAVQGGSIPTRTPEHSVLCADMNGNGSQDIVWIHGGQGVQFLELFPVRPHLLTRIENGLGRVTEASYGTSVEQAAKHLAATGQRWRHQLPFPMTLLEKLDEYDLLSQVHDVTVYRYRDGFYDGVEKQFRGYAAVEGVLEGDESQEEGLTASEFDVGESDPHRAGLPLGERVWGANEELQERRSTYALCPVAEVPAPAELEALGRKAVRRYCKTREETIHKERQAPSAWITTGRRWEYDGYANVTLELEEGVTAVGAGGCEASATTPPGHPRGANCLGDERVTQRWFVPTTATGGRWITGALWRERVANSASSTRFAETLTYYDGEAFAGLPEGTLSQKGQVTRVVRRLDDAGATVQAERWRRDAHGNVVESIDANGSEAEANAHRRRYLYDGLGLNLLQTDVFLARADGTPYQLRREVLYDPVFNQPVEATAWMRVEAGAVVTARMSTSWTYDAFGRVRTAVLPGGDTPASPSRAFEYALASPVSRVVVRSRSTVGGPLDLEHLSCLDGRNREVQQRTRTASGSYLVSGFKVYNLKGNVVRAYQPYTSSSAACDAAPPSSGRFESYRYDALDRVVQVQHPDGELHASASLTKTEYLPLAERHFDPEDNDPSSPHAGTPTTLRRDGLDRLLRVERLLTASGNPIALTLSYDELGNLRGMRDANGKEKLQAFDLLGRVTAVDDPSSAGTSFKYDAVGNLVERADARNRVTRMAYDGDNRLAERWDANDRAGTLVRAIYDRPESCPPESCTNTAGLVTELIHPGGAERRGYDARGQTLYEGRQLDGLWLETTFAYDNAGRLTEQTMPDGQVLRNSYDLASRLTRVEGAIDGIEYDARGLIGTARYANGTRQAREYDALMRVGRIDVVGSTLVQRLGLGYDRAGNVVSLRQEGGTALKSLLPAAQMPGEATSASYDALYRLVAASLDPATPYAEQLSFAYDGADALLSATSSLGAASPAHRGAYGYHPLHAGAIASAAGRTHEYDDAGLMIGRGSQQLEWDGFGRLTSWSDGGTERARFEYGPDERRTVKIEGGAVTLYAGDDFEIRDGISSTYVRLGRDRVVRFDSDALATRLYSDVAPLGGPDGKITAADAWTSLAASNGILSVPGERSSPERLLHAAARRLLFLDAPNAAWLHHDHLGSATLATGPSGQILGWRVYHPFGQLRASSGFVDPHGFTGQERDESTGLDVFAFRMFDPENGRWLTPDPAFEVLDAAALERAAEASARFAYVGNNPVSAFDPLGLWGNSVQKAEAKLAKAKLDVKTVGPRAVGKLKSEAKKRTREIMAVGIASGIAGAGAGGAVGALVTGPLAPLGAAAGAAPGGFKAIKSACIGLWKHWKIRSADKAMQNFFRESSGGHIPDQGKVYEKAVFGLEKLHDLAHQNVAKAVAQAAVSASGVVP